MACRSINTSYRFDQLANDGLLTHFHFSLTGVVSARMGHPEGIRCLGSCTAVPQHSPARHTCRLKPLQPRSLRFCAWHCLSSLLPPPAGSPSLLSALQEGSAQALHDLLCPLSAHLKEWDMKVGAVVRARETYRAHAAAPPVGPLAKEGNTRVDLCARQRVSPLGTICTSQASTRAALGSPPDALPC